MAAGTSQSKFLETINSVALLQKQLADLVEVVTKLAVKVEGLESRLSSVMKPDGR